MARPLRIENPGSIYHITSRGNARQPIFELEPSLKETKKVSKVPRRQRFAGRPGLEGLFADIGDKPNVVRNRIITRIFYTLVLE